MSTAAPSYPFSKVATLAEEPVPPNVDRLRKGKGLMDHLRKSLIAPEKRHMVDVLFSRRHPMRLKPGAVLTVHTKTSPFQFSGVLISIRRRGADTSFVLRNIVQRTGVEMQFFVNSPDLKSISVQSVAPGKNQHKAKRAKLYYLRHSPEKMTAISAGVKA